MKKGQHGKKHDIKTKYGFDRLVEDLIQESMSKGEFDNLSGKGKPLKDQNANPYVDFTTHKLNEVKYKIILHFTLIMVTDSNTIFVDDDYYCTNYKIVSGFNKQWLHSRMDNNGQGDRSRYTVPEK